jgi:tetratricopeptide (TPR) repeat protein
VDYTRAIEIDPGSHLTYLDRGLAYWLEGRQAEAQRDFDQCLELNPDLKSLLEERLEQIKRLRQTEP